MTIKYVILVFALGKMLFFPSASFCQEITQNTFALTFTPIHLFYEGFGFYNKNEPPQSTKLNWKDPFRGKLRFAVGMRYSRVMKDKYSLDFDFYKFSAAYIKNDISEYLSNQYNLINKYYYATSASINRNYSFKGKLKPKTGLGFLLRKNTDQFLRTLGYCPNCSVIGFQYIRYEIGVNLRVGLNYQWTKRMSTFVEANQNLIFYQSDSYNRNIFFENGLPKKHFSKIETFLNVGIGYSF